MVEDMRTPGRKLFTAILVAALLAVMGIPEMAEVRLRRH